MGPVELLRNKRNALVRDDEAILLLMLGQGEKRPHELRVDSGMPERSFWRCLSACRRQAWISSEKSRPTGEKVGRGWKSIVRLTPKGVGLVRKILGDGPQGEEARDQKQEAGSGGQQAAVSQ